MIMFCENVDAFSHDSASSEIVVTSLMNSSWLVKRGLWLWSILVMWFECRFPDTEVDGSNPGIRMLCPSARHFIRIASVDSAVK